MTAQVPGQLTVDGAAEGRDVAERYGRRPDGVAPIVTTGRIEYVADCPGCGAAHRHTGPGLRRGPCGTTYTIPTDQTEQDQETDHA